MARVSLSFDSVSTEQLRSILATFSRFKANNLVAASDIPDCVVRNDGPNRWQVRVPHMVHETAFDFMHVAFNIVPTPEWELDLLGLVSQP